MNDQILNLFQGMSPEDQAFTLRLLEAKVRANQSPLAYIEELMSFQYIGREGEHYVHRMEVRPEISNRYGMLHGGILSTFIDTCMGATCFLENGTETKTVTLDLQVRFLKQAKSGKLTAKTSFQKNGRTIASLETHVFDDKGDIVGSATASFFKIHAK